MRNLTPLMTLSLILGLMVCPALATQNVRTIPAIRVASPPLIDGSQRDPAWSSIPPVAIRDRVADVNILLRAAYDDSQLYFLVMFPDSAENSFHKPWIWDQTASAYVEGAHREDTFVFKWNMEARDLDLLATSDDDYRSDVWYWKANRSNPAGYADDKIDSLVGKSAPKATEVVSKSGRTRYLLRDGDRGDEACREIPAPTAFAGPLVNRYVPREPTGSRADVRAKGVWSGGFWTIEFARTLQTGNPDDVQFDPAAPRQPLFGVSIFSIYGHAGDKSQPNLYGMGEISEPLRLEFL